MKTSLLRQLKTRYLNAGQTVYSRHFRDLEAAPPQWNGAAPDLIVSRWGSLTAIFLVSEARLLDPQTGQAWREALKNPRTRLKLLVEEKEHLSQVRRLLQRLDISARVALIRRSACPRPRSFHPRRRTVAVGVFILLLCTVLTVLYYGVRVWQAEAQLYYQPRDLERQMETLKEKIDRE